MPRVAKPANAAGTERVRRWRVRNREVGRPEASEVDIAVAAAVAGYASQAAVDLGMDVVVLKRILDDAVDQMVATGRLKRKEARRKLIRRVGRFTGTVPGEQSATAGNADVSA